MRIVVEPGEYVVARVAGAAKPPMSFGLSAALTVGDETTVVCPYGEEPLLADVERGWRWLRLEAVMGFTEVGVIRQTLVPLAVAGVPVFVLSTFSTDHILLPGGRLADAKDALRRAGFEVVG